MVNEKDKSHAQQIRENIYDVNNKQPSTTTRRETTWFTHYGLHPQEILQRKIHYIKGTYNV